MEMQKPRKRPYLFVEEVDDEVVVYDPHTKYLHHLNPMATIVWELCDGSQGPKEITSEIVNTLKVDDPSRVEKDVLETLEQLRKKGLVE
jgi:PqqD family protein of HPr-rel-A system